MQLYTAYKVKVNPQFGNFSETGMEKTLSAILASRVIDSNVTLIVCPNDVVEQWKNVIREAFPDYMPALYFCNTHIWNCVQIIQYFVKSIYCYANFKRQM